MTTRHELAGNCALINMWALGLALAGLFVPTPYGDAMTLAATIVFIVCTGIFCVAEGR